MRKIYESDALGREDEDPFQPNENEDRPAPTAARTLPAATLSRWLTPSWLRRRAISISVTTPDETYRQGDSVPVSIRMKNSLPFPITIDTQSPLVWTWAVDGHREASHDPETPPSEPGDVTFDRGEWKRFRRTWSGMFHVAQNRWEEASSGEHTISAALNVTDPQSHQLVDETTITITK
jgi:hypothetical protein